MPMFRHLLIAQLMASLYAALMFFTLVLILFYIAGSPPPADVSILIWEFGFLSMLVSAKMVFLQGRYISVLKTHSKNLLSLWFYILLQNIVIIVFAFLVLPFYLKLAPFSFEQQFSKWEWLSHLITIFLFMINLDSYLTVDRIQRGPLHKGAMLRRFLYITIAIVAMGSVLYIYNKFSPLVGCLLVNIALVFDLLFDSDEPIKSIPLGMRWKVSGSIAILLVVVEFALGYADLRTSPVVRFAMVPEKTWNFSDIEKVKTIDDWIHWQNKLKSLDKMSADDLLASYERLQELCAPQKRDNPLMVSCYSEQPDLKDYQFTGKTSKSEEEVLKLMSSENEYAQIIGIMYARKLPKPMSANMITAIENLAEKESNIQILARNTLSQSFAGNYRDGITITTTNK